MAEHDLGMTTFGQYWRRAVQSGRGYALIGTRFARTSDKLWLRELAINMVTIPFLLASAAALWYLGGLLAVALLVLAGMCAIARKCFSLRRRRMSVFDSLLYSLHVYAFKLPLFIGAIGYLVGGFRNQRSA